MYTMFRRLRAARDKGASAVEYALVLAAVVAIVASVVFIIGKLVQKQLDDSCRAVKAGTTTSSDNCPRP